MDEAMQENHDPDRRDDGHRDDGHRDGGFWDDDLDALRSELDALAERDDSRWADLRRVIRLRLDEESAASRTGRRSWLRPAWAAPVLAAGLLAVALLVVPGHEKGPLPVPPPNATPNATPTVATDSTAELLRSVEATLAADPAASLAPAGLLVAELEQQYAALQDDEPDG